MTQACPSSLRAERIRVATLTTAGAPSTGAKKGYVSDAQIKVDLSPEIETGDSGTQKNGGGRICASFADPDRIARVSVSMDLCQFDAELVAMLTQGSTYQYSTEVVGYQPPLTTDDLDVPVCLEVWTRAWNGSSQLAHASQGGDVTYIHWVFPFCKFTLGNVTLDGAIHVLPVSGKSEENDALTANGPFNDWPSWVANAGGVQSCFAWFFDDTPPSATCGAITVPSGS